MILLLPRGVTRCRIVQLVTLVGLATFAFCSSSATLELEALDYKNCRRWGISSDSVGQPSPAYAAAEALSSKHPGTLVFSAGRRPLTGEYLQMFGACHYRAGSAGSEFACLPGLDFPLAGAKFRGAKIQTKSRSEVLVCIAGCTRGVPAIVHVLNQDIVSEKQFEADEHQRLRAFNKVCNVASVR